MTQRQRQRSVGAVATAPPSVPRAAPAAVPPRRPPWESLFASLSPAVQRELLDLASRQGVLYAHQLPPPNGAVAGNAALKHLQQLLGGQIADLEPVRPEAVAVQDAALDVGQRDAVARAVHTPDVCLIQGLPGAGKARVVAEIVRQAAARGERVLLLAPTSTPLDRVLEQVANDASVAAVRCLGHQEGPETLREGIRALLYTEQARRFQTNALRRAEEAVQSAQEECRRHAAREPVLERLERLAAEAQALAAQAAELQQRRAEVPRLVAVQATEEPQSALGSAIAERVSRRDQAVQRLDSLLKELAAEQDRHQKEASDMRRQLHTLQPLADAKKLGRWWSAAWWRAAFQPNCISRCHTLAERVAESERKIETFAESRRDVERERAAIEADFSSAREGLIQGEIERRWSDLAAAERALTEKKTQWQTDWDAVLRGLGDIPAPLASTPESVAGLRAAWTAQRVDAGKRQDFATEWLGYLREDAAALPARFGSYVNLVAASTTALAGDPHFGDGAPHGQMFDVLILKEAERITQSEFLSVARRARRWVLVGEPSLLGADGPHAAPLHGEAPTRGEPAISSAFFQAAWQKLHSNPSQLPYAWRRENDRLVCQLRPVPAAQRHHLEKESVADHPEIELRILTLPRTPPFLAEITFPSSMSILEAKRYIFREIEELAVSSPAQSLRWIEDDAHLVIQFDAATHAETLSLTLEPGVHEFIAPLKATRPASLGAAQAWYTAALHFERSAGWNRASAEAWVRKHTGLHDCGRTALLDVPHRMDPDLARFLTSLVPGVAYRLLDSATGATAATAVARCAHCPAAVQFIPVPPLANGERAQAPRRDGKGGAGLELDLADWRFRDHLPTELRPLLPNQGLVNYLEAQAVVRTLEAMARERHADADGNGAPQCRCRHGTVAVVALYPAQVELIRQLVRQSPALAASGLAVEVDSAEAFCHRDCSVLLVSLTRSHTHRAVSFGQNPQALVRALMRARDRLILFGDAGTLVRRTQWQGRLDHLDETAASRERDVISYLVRYVQGDGPYPSAFHLHEGRRT